MNENKGKRIKRKEKRTYLGARCAVAAAAAAVRVAVRGAAIARRGGRLGHCSGLARVDLARADALADRRGAQLGVAAHRRADILDGAS